MASLLRSLKMLRFGLLPVPGFLFRNQPIIYRSTTKRLIPHTASSKFVENVRLVSSSSVVYDTPESDLHSSKTLKRDTDFRAVLRRLDDMVQRTGRISKNQLLGVFEEVCKMGSASPNQALLLIRSCGSLLPEVSSEDRTALGHKIWDKLAVMGTMYDVSHYNALLKIYLQNEHKFSPTDFLGSMEAKSLEPNRVTYQRLISAYCLVGDIQGATKILEFMKTKDLPVTEGVFNSLITGHARAGDMDSAHGILDVMRNVGLEPSQDTYSALLCSLAEKGDIEGIEKVCNEVEAHIGALADRYYLSVVYSLATSGNQEHVSKILEKVRLGASFVPDTINLTLSLITQGQVETAYSIMKLIKVRQPSTTNSDGDQPTHGNFFIDPLVRCGQPLEVLFKYLDDMMAGKLHSTPYTVALHVALRNQGGAVTNEYVVGIIKKMVELGMTVRPHYFWPLMSTEANKGNNEGVLKLAANMLDAGVPLSAETFTKYVIPAIGGESGNIVDKLQKLGIPIDKQMMAAVCREHVTRNRVDEVVQLLDVYPDFVEVSLFKTGLINSFHRSPQVEPFTMLMVHLWENFVEESNSNITRQDYLGSVLYDLIKAIPQDRALLLKPELRLLLDKLKHLGIQISSQRFRGIRNVLDDLKLPMLKPLAQKLLDSEELMASPLSNIDLVMNDDASVDDLEAYLKQMKEKGGNYRSIIRRLILQYTANNNYQRAMELIAEFEVKGYEATGAIYASLISLCCNHGNFEEALLFKKKLEQCDPYFKLDMSKYRPLICSFAKQNKMDEALKLVQELKDRALGTDRQEKVMFHLLNELAEQGLSQETQQIFDKLVDLNIVKANNNIMGPVVKSYIVKNDIEGAMQCIMDCQSKYNVMPHFHELLVKLVEGGDTGQLQKAMDFTSKHHGDVNMLFDLIFAFLATGKYKEARRVFETPGMVAKDRRLQWFAEQCLSRNQSEALENLVAMSRDLYGCDRDNMHFYLIQLYARQKDSDKCLQVWTAMQDEGVVPKDRTLRYLANVLHSLDKPVPFEIPEIDTTYQQETQDSAGTGSNDLPTDYESRIIQAARSGDLDGAMSLMDEARSQNVYLRMPAYDTLMWEYLKQSKIKEFQRVKDMCTSLEDFKLSRNLKNKLITEYMHQGDSEAAHEVYDEILDSGGVPLRSGIRFLATYYEESSNLDKLKEMKVKYEEATKDTFPMGKSILGVFLQRNDVAGASEFIEQDVKSDITRVRRIGLRSFFVRLIQKEADMEEVFKMIDRLNQNNMDGGIWQLLFAYLDCSRIQEARDLVQKYPSVKAKSSGLIGYIISMIGRDTDTIQKINNVLEMTHNEDYIDKEKLYFYLLKSYDQANSWEDALKLHERMASENIPMTDFNLKRLALLLQRNDQPVPFDEPPNSLSFYRDQSRVGQKDNLAEIEELPLDSRQARNSTD